MTLDHLILMVRDRDKSLRFYTTILGLPYEGERDPFSVVRVNADTTLQLAPWGTKGGEHLAFSMTRAEFEATFLAGSSNGSLPVNLDLHRVSAIRLRLSFAGGRKRWKESLLRGVGARNLLQPARAVNSALKSLCVARPRLFVAAARIFSVRHDLGRDVEERAVRRVLVLTAEKHLRLELHHARSAGE